MIQLLQAKNFRMLRSNSVALEPYQVLVGQNATGKSTFLKSIRFLSDVLKYGVRLPVEETTSNFYDLCFNPDEPLSLAVELSVPDPGAQQQRRVRYEIEIGITLAHGLEVLRENLFLLDSLKESNLSSSDEVVHHDGKISKRWKRILSRSGAAAIFRPETTRRKFSFHSGYGETAFGSLLG
ncbi:MAG: AAA family ATPase, partial [bacterium]